MKKKLLKIISKIQNYYLRDEKKTPLKNPDSTLRSTHWVSRSKKIKFHQCMHALKTAFVFLLSGI